MTKQKIISIIGAVIILGGLTVYLFVTQGKLKVVSREGFIDNATICGEGNRMSTTTKKCEPKPIYVPTVEPTTVATTTPFTFGPLKNVYEDKKFGFSLRYPDEVVLENTGDCLSVRYNDKSNYKEVYAITFLSPSCAKRTYQPNRHSPQDYRQDYVMKDGGVEHRIHVINTVDFVTKSGARGMEQYYEAKDFDADTGEEIVCDGECGHLGSRFLNYLFFKDDKIFYALSILNLSYERGKFNKLNDAIIQSISY